jgi:hypothetical protein
MVLLLLLLPLAMLGTLLLLPSLLLLLLVLLCAASITTAPWGVLGTVLLLAVSLAVETLQGKARQQRNKGQTS